MKWEKFAIEFDSEEDAELKFEELSNEAEWFSFDWGQEKTLLNTFCFRRFYLSSDVNSDGIRIYYLVFWNNDQDQFKIVYEERSEAIEDLKALVI